MTNNELKSKVMSLGNKLAPWMDGDRSAAFVKAWAVCKAGTMELAVRGVSFGNRQEALKRLSGYNPADVRVFLVPEPRRSRRGGRDGGCSERQGALPPGLCAPDFGPGMPGKAYNRPAGTFWRCVRGQGVPGGCSYGVFWKARKQRYFPKVG